MGFSTNLYQRLCKSLQDVDAANELQTLVELLSAISSGEISVLDAVTAGTVTGGKVALPDSNKDLGSFRDVTVRKVKIGDSANDNTITITSSADEAADRVASIPALGADDTFAMRGQANDFTGRQTTTDGVSGGTAKVIGGRATANVSASDSVTAVASNNTFIDFAQTYTIKANMLKAGSVLRCKVYVRVSNASGTDTLSVQIMLGSTQLIVTTAVDPGATTDHHILEFELVARAAPGAAASVIGFGRWITNTGGTIAHGTGQLVATNFATNGDLVLKASAKWSSNTVNTACIMEAFDVDID